MTFMQKLLLVLSSREYMKYSDPALLLVIVVGFIIISGVFGPDYLWVSALLLVCTLLISIIILVYGVYKLWKQFF